MARIRSLKPTFFTDGDVTALPPLHRLVFAGLWCHADRAGRLPDKPRELKVLIAPFDDCDMEVVLSDLAKAKDGQPGLIRRYHAGGKRCIQITNFAKHQKPHPKEPPSEIPEPPPWVANEPRLSMVEPRKNTAEQCPATVQPGGVLVLGSGLLVEESGACAAPPPADAAPPKEKRPRKPSEQQEFAAWFEEQRKAALGPLWTEDKELGPSRLNKELGWVATADKAETSEATAAYLNDPRRRAQDPPCSLLWFSRDRAEYVSKAKRQQGLFTPPDDRPPCSGCGEQTETALFRGKRYCYPCGANAMAQGATA